MINIRFGLFETNSSSVHNFSIVNLDDFKKWKAGKLLFVSNNLFDSEDLECETKDFERVGDYYYLKKEFVTKEEAEIIDFFYPYDISEDYYNNYYYNDLEYFVDTNGEDHRRHFVTYKEFFDCIDYSYSDYVEEDERHNVAVFGYYGYDG